MTKIMVIAGCNSGIGLGILQACLPLYDQAYCLDRKGEFVSQFDPASLVYLPTDLSNLSHIHTTLDTLLSKLQYEDDLQLSVVFSAGVTMDALTHDIPEESFSTIMQTNFFSCYMLMKSLLPLMMASQYGRLLTIGSISHTMIGAGGGSSAYECSKASLVQLTRAIAVDYAHYNIRANCISPGEISTQLLENSEAAIGKIDQQQIEIRPYNRKQRPVEVCGGVDDVAAIAKFILSSDINFLTGSNIVIDGAMTLV